MNPTVWFIVAPFWSVSLPQTDSGQILSFRFHRGLWIECTSGSNGINAQCSRYWQGITYLFTSGLIQQCAMVIVSVFFSLTAILTGTSSTNGLNCDNCNLQFSKMHFSILTIILYFLSGLIMIISVSISANRIIKQNWILSPITPDMIHVSTCNVTLTIEIFQRIRSTLGYCIYCGWVGIVHV